MFTNQDIPMLNQLDAIARRVARMTYNRATREYAMAFGSDDTGTLNMCVILNSLIDHERGKPWLEVDYHHMRRAKWLCERSWEPNRIVNQWYRRKCGLNDTD